MDSSLIELRIKAIRDETHDSKSFVLEPARDIPYIAGQFLTLVFPDRLHEKRRSYSISSSAKLGDPLTITVKRIDNGEFSRFLFDRCRVGDVLYTIGASGLFTLPADSEKLPAFAFMRQGVE